MVVGRCADVILAYQDNVVNVFIYADMEDKIDRIMKLYSLEDRQKAAKLIKKTEKIRRNYYQYYTDEVWGDKRNKALMINTSAAGVDGAGLFGKVKLGVSNLHAAVFQRVQENRDCLMLDCTDCRQ